MYAKSYVRQKFEKKNLNRHDIIVTSFLCQLGQKGVILSHIYVNDLRKNFDITRTSLLCQFKVS